MRRCRLRGLMSCMLAFVLALVMNVTVYASSGQERGETAAKAEMLAQAETLAASVDPTDYNIHYIFVVDEDGEFIYYETAIVVVGNDGTYYVLTDSELLEYEDYGDYEFYLWLNTFDEDDMYLLADSYDCGCGIALIEFDSSAPDSSAVVSLDEAVSGEEVSLVYEGSDGFYSVGAQVTSISEANSDGYYEIDASFDETISDFYYPIWIIDEYGSFTGMYTSDQAMYAFFASDSTAGSSDDTDPTEDTEPSENTDTTDDDDTESTTSPSRTESRDSDDDNDDDPDNKAMMIKLIIGAAAVVIVVVVVLLLTKMNKNKQSPSGQPPVAPPPVQPPYPPAQGETEMWVQPETPQQPGVGPQPISSIVGISGVMSGRAYPVNADSIMFGRDPSAYVRFAPETKGVSRNHCRLFKNHSGEWMVMDCGSTYGTMLTRYGKLQPQHPVPVQQGDVIMLGSQENAFRLQ